MSYVDDPDDIAPTTVREDLILLDQTFNDTNAGRIVIEKQLGSMIQGMTISTDDPKVITAQMSMINTYASLLRDREANASRRVMSKLKQAETETASKHSANVADFLSKLTTNGVHFAAGQISQDPLTIDHDIEAAFEASESGPILLTELKTDPNDLSD